MATVSYTTLESSFTTSISKPGQALGFDTATAVTLFSSTSFLWSAGIMISVVAAGFMYMRAGIIRMQASEAGVRKSNAEIKRVTLGLLGVLSLFVILYTFNKGLLIGNVGLEGLKAKPVGSGSVGSAVGTGNIPTPPAPITGSGGYQARVASHNATVARLAPSNIHTNYADVPCTEAQFGQTAPQCTSLAYLPEETIQMLLKLNADCHCTVVITGGTEPGHKTHGENKRPVDLRIGGPRGDINNTDKLYSYVKNGAINKLGADTNCYEKYVFLGFTFCDEKPPAPQHFHVS